MATYYVDWAVGDDGNSGTGEGAGYAWKTIDHSMDVVAAGDHVYVKASAIYTEMGSCATSGSITGRIIFEGYTSTPGDGGLAVIDGESTRLSGLYLSSLVVYIVFKNFEVKNCTSHGISAYASYMITVKDCICHNNGSHGITLGSGCTAVGCVVYNNSSNGINGNNAQSCLSCVSYGNSDGFSMPMGVVALCLAYDNSTSGIKMTTGFTLNNVAAIINCTIDGDEDEHASVKGIEFTHGSIARGWDIVNTIIYDCNVGISSAVDVGEGAVSRNNLVNANTTDYSNADTFFDEITSAPAFTDEGADDYRLSTGSPAKAAGTDAGELNDSSSYVDLGALQRQEAGGGGGGVIGGPNLHGGRQS